VNIAHRDDPSSASGIRQPHLHPGVLGGIEASALSCARPQKMERAVLVSSADGVGHQIDRHGHGRPTPPSAATSSSPASMTILCAGRRLAFFSLLLYYMLDPQVVEQLVEA